MYHSVILSGRLMPKLEAAGVFHLEQEVEVEMEVEVEGEVEGVETAVLEGVRVILGRPTSPLWEGCPI